MTLLLMLLFQVPLGSTYTGKFVTTFDASNAEAPADAVPTCDVYEEITTTPILINGAMTLMAGTTNIYYRQETVSTGNGFEVGKWYNRVCEATVGGLQQNIVTDHFVIDPASSDPLITLCSTYGTTLTVGYRLCNEILRTSTINRPADVDANGNIGIDWSNISNPTTTVNLSGTTVKNATDLQALLPTALVGGKMDSNVGTYTTGQGGFTIRKNVGVANYPFKLFLLGTATPATGLTTAAITCYVSKDGAAGAITTDTTETEVDGTNMPGWYVVDLSSAETNAGSLIFKCKAATTEPAEFQIIPEN